MCIKTTDAYIPTHQILCGQPFRQYSDMNYPEVCWFASISTGKSQPKNSSVKTTISLYTVPVYSMLSSCWSSASHYYVYCKQSTLCWFQSRVHFFAKDMLILWCKLFFATCVLMVQTSAQCPSSPNYSGCLYNSDCKHIGDSCLQTTGSTYEDTRCDCFTCSGISANPFWYEKDKYEASFDQYCAGVYARQGKIFIASVVIVIASLTAFTFYMAKFDWVTTGKVFVLLAIPIVDVISDVIYLATVLFYNKTIFAMGIICVILPVFHFMYYLVQMSAFPKWFLLSPPKALQFPGDYSNLAQIILYLILHLPWIILHAPIFVPMYIFGCFLFMTKLFSIGKIHDIWMYAWTGSNDFASPEDIDTKLYNETYFSGVLMESIPQFILQVINSVYTKQMNAITVVSISFSAMMIINSVYRFVYFVLHSKTPLRDIPILFLKNIQLAGVVGEQRGKDGTSTGEEDNNLTEGLMGSGSLHDGAVIAGGAGTVTVEMVQSMIRSEVSKAVRTECQSLQTGQSVLREELEGLKRQLAVGRGGTENSQV